MYSSGLLAALGFERQKSFHDEAAAQRRGRHAVELTRSYDLANVRIRPIRPTDGNALREGFARLSPESRWLRFLTVKKELSPAEVRYFTDIDHERHVALVAVNATDGQGLGVARYVRDTDDPDVADLAVTVVDEWQGRGLGTKLLHELSVRARSSGITRFSALTSVENI